MKTKISKIHIPSGCEILIGSTEAELVSLGVIPSETETTLEITYSVVEKQGSKAEEVITYVRDMVAKGSSELYQIDLENINKLSGGLLQITKIAGTQVAGETFTIPSVEKAKFYALPGQNSTGAKQTITTVKQGSKTLTEATDYVQIQNERGEWGLMILAASTATTASIVVTYSYTPTASIKASMGSGCQEITSNVVRFLKVMNGKKFQATLHKAKMTNGIKFSFPSVDSENLPSLPIEIEGKIDTTRADGDQLIEIIDEFGV